MFAISKNRPLGRTFFYFIFFFSFLVSISVQAYDCGGLPAYTYGAANVGTAYTNVNAAWRCSASWCAWARPGEDSWADGAWESLGNCSEVIPENTAPTVSITTSSGTILAGETVTFTAEANDSDGNIVSYNLTVYEVTMDGNQVPQVIDAGTSNSGVSNVLMQGTWSSNETKTYVLVAEVTDAEGEEAYAERRFTVGQDVNPTMVVHHSEELRRGSQGQVSVEADFPGWSLRPEIEILSPSGTSVGTNGSSSSASSSSGATYTMWRVNKVFPATEIGEYQVSVIWESAPALNHSGVINVVGDGVASVEVYPPTLYQFKSSSFSLSATHPTSGDVPAVTINNTSTGEEILYLDGVDSRTLPGASSSSSSGGSGGHYFTLISNEMVFATAGEHSLQVNYPDGLSAEDHFTVLSGFEYPGGINIAISSPGLEHGIYAINVDTDYFDVSGVEIFIDGIEVDAEGEAGINTRYAWFASYDWQAEPGSHTILARATNVRGDTFEESMNFVVEGEEEGGACAEAGIQLADVHAYPNFPNLDWKGDPFNANTGDLMSYQQAVYRARWWTQSIPGSDQSWEYVCAL